MCRERGPVFDRRSFLKTACTSAVAVSISDRFTAFADAASSSDIRAYVTDTKRRHESLPLINWSSATANSENDELVVDDGVRYQPLLGFGRAFTDASCYLF